MYEYLAPLRNSGMCSRKQLVDVLERIVGYLVDDLEGNARKIDGNNKQRVLTSIASISNNNDLKIGDYIAGIFQKLNFLSDVRIEEDPRDSSVPLTHSIRYGFTFDRGPIHNLYFNQAGRSTLAVKEPLVYMSYEFFPPHYENLKEIQKANPDRAIVAIVEQTHEDTVNECLSDFLKGNNKILLIRAGDMSLEAYHDEFLDAAIYLDSDIIRDPNTFKPEQLGACKSVEFYGTKTVFMSGDGMVRGTDFYNERVQQLEKEYDEIPNNLPSKRGAIRLRLSKLSGVSVKILVGGITEEEKKARRFLVEDAVLACKSALAKGYGFGGNVNLYFAMTRLCDRFDTIWEGDYVFNQFSKEFVKTIFLQLRRVYFDTYFCIMTKLPEYEWRGEKMRDEIVEETDRIFNVLTGAFENLDETTVLAPIDTDVQILKASVSIMGMLISINQFVSC
jgi:chaperonin GroEL (HSP60 family)